MDENFDKTYKRSSDQFHLLNMYKNSVLYVSLFGKLFEIRRKFI